MALALQVTESDQTVSRKIEMDISTLVPYTPADIAELNRVRISHDDVDSVISRCFAMNSSNYESLVNILCNRFNIQNKEELILAKFMEGQAAIIQSIKGPHGNKEFIFGYIAVQRRPDGLFNVSYKIYRNKPIYYVVGELVSNEVMTKYYKRKALEVFTGRNIC